MHAQPAISFHATLTGATTTPWPDSLEIARSAGFAAIDIVLPEIATEPTDAIREQLWAASLAPGPASLPVEFRLDEDTFRRDLAGLEHFASLAAGTGVKTMFRSIPASSHMPTRELRPILQRRISTCAKILGEHGIDFAIEPIGPLHRRREGPHEFIWRVPDAAEFVTTCEGDVGLLVDSWHWHHSQGTVDQIVELGSLVRHVHVADAADIPENLVRDHQRLLPGHGIIDHRAFGEALRKIDYSRFISPEVRGYRCQSSSATCASAALTAVQSALAPSKNIEPKADLVS
jgi:sugar phosphate isomerase/epimerase